MTDEHIIVEPTRALHGSARGADQDAPHGGGGLSRALPLAIALAAVLGLAMTIIWALTGSHGYWPRWVWLGCFAAIAPFAGAAYALTQPIGERRWHAIDVVYTGAVAVIVLLVWAFSGGGLFWPAWPLLALGLMLVTHTLIVFRDRLLPGRNRRLADRVETLARTRRGALDVQTVQLQRIERDLHDGAQARLVALSMQLGRAEARLDADPEAAALVRAARKEAGAAIAELRDLARGIAPPVLADRGLEAAVQSIAERSPIVVTVTAEHLDHRLPAVVETAAYFVVAEALTNVVKHAPGAVARVTVARRGDLLLVDVADGGPGGANPAGSGLDGLRARVEALDGVLTVASPVGGPTIIHAELPCES